MLHRWKCFVLCSDILKADISLGVLAILSVQWLRRWSYEIFLRTHQAFAGLFVYGTWRHLPAGSRHPRSYLFVALGIFGLSFLLQLATFLYRNGLFAGRGSPRALVSFTWVKAENEDPVATATHIRVLLPRPVRSRPDSTSTSGFRPLACDHGHRHILS